MDWLTAIATLLTAIAAFIAAIAAIWQARLLRFSLGIDTLMRLDDRFNSDGMRSTRRKAASYLLRQNFKPDLVLPDGEEKCRVALDDLLDFFEGISFLARKRKTPDPEDVWCFFFVCIDYYCRAAKEHIEQARKEDELKWKELVDFHKQLVGIEHRYRREYKQPNNEQLRRFLEDEARPSV